MGHAAALSRYFWPSPQGGEQGKHQRKIKQLRGKKLRKAFALDESSALFNRDLRNAWEHFDERLDAYLLENHAGYFFPGCILDSHTLTDGSIGHIFKLLDIEEECLVLMGEKYFFNPMRHEVKRVFELAYKADNNEGRLPK